MIRLFALLILLFISSVVFAQKDSLAKSLIEDLSNKSGTLFRKEYSPLKKISNIELNILTVTDLLHPENPPSKGIRFEYHGTYNEYIAFIDSDELDALIASLEYMIPIVIEDTLPHNYTELIYKSRSGFNVGCFYTKGEWQPFSKIVSYSDKSFVPLEKTSFGQLYETLKYAKQLVKN